MTGHHEGRADDTPTVVSLPAGFGPGCAPRAYARLRRVLGGRHGAEVPRLVCDAAAVVRPDLGTLDALARLQLLAHRHGTHVSLRGPDDRLRELLTLSGLDAVLPFEPGGAGSVEPGGQPEQGEQPRLEELGEPHDPPP